MEILTDDGFWLAVDLAIIFIWLVLITSWLVFQLYIMRENKKTIDKALEEIAKIICWQKE